MWRNFWKSCNRWFRKCILNFSFIGTIFLRIIAFIIITFRLLFIKGVATLSLLTLIICFLLGRRFSLFRLFFNDFFIIWVILILFLIIMSFFLWQRLLLLFIFIRILVVYFFLYFKSFLLLFFLFLLLNLTWLWYLLLFLFYF